MGTAMDKEWNVGQSGGTTGSDLNRLSEVKEIFKNLVTRISAYRLPTQLGLVTFSNHESVQVNQELTPVLYDFQDRLNDVSYGGGTSIYDALMKAKAMLATFAVAHPGAKRRIILLTDGCDNASKCTPERACKELCNNDIVLDAIVIGTDKTWNLFKIAKHTGGYAFNPTSRDLLFQIFLLDGCIDIKTRPDIVKVPMDSYATSSPKVADMQTKYEFPPCRPHPHESDSFISLRVANRYFTTLSNRLRQPINSRASSVSTNSTLGSGATAVTGAGGQGRRFLNEVLAMISNPHPSMDVYVSETNIGCWKVVMSGPVDSAYEKGTFVLFVDIGEHFPVRAPSARFITPVLHPNITKVSHRRFDTALRVSETNQLLSMAESVMRYSIGNGRAVSVSTNCCSTSGVFSGR